MSTEKHTIEIEGLPEGYEPVAFRVPMKTERWIDSEGDVVNPNLNDYYPKVPRLIVRRKVRKYDWGKTHSGTLVTRVDQDGYWTCGISFALGKQACIADLWQPNIHGKCPVDGEACWVRVRYLSGDIGEVAANILDWSLSADEGTVIAWQFLRLADGYEW